MLMLEAEGRNYEPIWNQQYGNLQRIEIWERIKTQQQRLTSIKYYDDEYTLKKSCVKAREERRRLVCETEKSVISKCEGTHIRNIYTAFTANTTNWAANAFKKDIRFQFDVHIFFLFSVRFLYFKFPSLFILPSMLPWPIVCGCCCFCYRTAPIIIIIY